LTKFQAHIFSPPVGDDLHVHGADQHATDGATSAGTRPDADGRPRNTEGTITGQGAAIEG